MNVDSHDHSQVYLELEHVNGRVYDTIDNYLKDIYAANGITRLYMFIDIPDNGMCLLSNFSFTAR